MKNQDAIHRIESLIDTLNEIQILSNTAINELERIKRELIVSKQETFDTKGKQQETANANTPDNSATKAESPDTEQRNMVTIRTTQHIDSKGKSIQIGDNVRILSTGLHKGGVGTVTKLGKVRILLRLKLGRSTNRKSTNLEILQRNAH